jgi:GTP cyclohydrolase I
VRELLFAIGEDPDREGLRETPGRVARAYASSSPASTRTRPTCSSTTFSIDHEELIIVRDIEVYSTCEHHLLPFHGVAHVGYIPAEDGKVTGLSKLGPPRRGVRPPPAGAGADHHPGGRRPRDPPRGPGGHRRHRGRAPVHVDAWRAKPGSRTITSAVRGQLRDPATRSEAMSLLLGGKR